MSAELRHCGMPGWTSLTCGSRRCSRGLDGRAVPAVDGVQNTVFLFALSGEPRHSSAVDNGLSSAGVDDAWENGTTMAAISISRRPFWHGHIGAIHSRDDRTVGVHLRSDALQTLGLGIINQRGMAGRSEENAILFPSH